MYERFRDLRSTVNIHTPSDCHPELFRQLLDLEQAVTKLAAERDEWRNAVAVLGRMVAKDATGPAFPTAEQAAPR